MEQAKNKDNKDSINIEANLSVNNLRNYLNEIYKCYSQNECGDPMETMGYIFDLIYKPFAKGISKAAKPKKIANVLLISFSSYIY